MSLKGRETTIKANQIIINTKKFGKKYEKKAQILKRPLWSIKYMVKKHLDPWILKTDYQRSWLGMINGSFCDKLKKIQINCPEIETND